MIDNDTQLMIVVNDVTRIKELESYNFKVRSLFFSSIAHELRTPLNSIFPMVDNLLRFVTDERGLLYLKIIKNSSMHLSNLIEDALDMSRIENNRFEANCDYFDIRNAVEEVAQIMEF